MARRVVLAVGLPGSGKSAWFHKRGITPLSSDWLRQVLADDASEQRYQKQVFAALRSLLRSRLKLGRPVTYIDATNLTPSERRHYLRIARRFGCRAEAIFFDVPLEVCLRRNRRRGRRVPESAMKRLAARLRPPSLDEGFASVRRVR